MSEYYYGRGKGIDQGTGWGAFNAVTEFLSHQDKKPETTFDGILSGNIAAQQTKAVEFLLGV
jgi:hypothetical protein